MMILFKVLLTIAVCSILAAFVLAVLDIGCERLRRAKPAWMRKAWTWLGVIAMLSIFALLIDSIWIFIP